ncbi:sodium/glutamate symporter [Oscillospiraceae bacterium 50-16]
MSANDFLLDFAVASLFILIGQLLRAKVGLFQKFFVPASMIAGFIALALGSQGANILPFSDQISNYPGMLIIVIFAAVGVNGFSFSKKAFKAEIDRIGSYLSYKVLAQAIQFGFAPLLSILIISTLFPDINYGFGLLLAAGFSGGHGTAAAVGDTFSRLGFTDANDIAMTCATVGILAGIFGGLFFVKLGTKFGWTKYIKGFQYISGDLRTGMVKDTENRPVMGKETTSSVSIDPLCWHFAVLLLASGAGIIVNKWIFKTFELDLPTYLIAFLIAIAMFLVFKRTGVSHYIDENIINRISGTATDFVVFFGIASIKIPVIVKYAAPLAILLVIGILIVVATLMFFGPAMNKGSWFERSLFVFGYSTGVFAIGFVLLRIVDPENRSKTLNDTAFAAPFTTPFEMYAWGFGPMMLLGGRHWQFVGMYVALTLACVAVNMIFRWWWLKLPLDRPAVEE